MFRYNYFTSLCSLLCIIILPNIGGVQSSAIPMWEFLSKQEKISYLYSLFANQVEEYCQQNIKTMPNCNLDLLKYGFNQLKEMSENDLDSLDPYQRDANNMIWESLMEGHALAKTTPAASSYSSSSSTTTKPNSYEDESFNDNLLGSASAKIDNYYRVLPPANFIIMNSGQPEYRYPTYRPKPVVKKTLNPYRKFNRIHNQIATTTPPPFNGPLVVKVYPDGRPVRDETQQLPQDDDLRQYQWTKTKIPNFN